MNKPRERWVVVTEDAGEDAILVVPEIPEHWICLECGQINRWQWLDCVMCGHDREEAEL